MTDDQPRDSTIGSGLNADVTAPDSGDRAAAIARFLIAAAVTIGAFVGAAALVIDVAFDPICPFGGCSERARVDASERIELLVAVLLFVGVPAIVAKAMHDRRWLVPPIAIALLIGVTWAGITVN